MSLPSALVLMYHGVDTVPAAQDPANLFVTPTALREQLGILRSAGFTPVDIDAYTAAVRQERRLPPRSVLLTFDDGFESTRTAAEILAEQRMPSICYVNPGLVGGRSRDAAGDHHAYDLLDEVGVRHLRSYDMAVGLHGWDHVSMVDQSPQSLEHQVADAKTRLCELLQEPVSSFAYPYGEHDQAARNAVRDAGFACSFATHDGHGRFAIPRVDINAADTPRTFRLKLRRWYPLARRASSFAPSLRRGIHHLVGDPNRRAAGGDR